MSIFVIVRPIDIATPVPLPLEITFEDNLSGVTTAPTYAVQDTTRTEAATNAPPGDTNQLILFEAPTALVESATGYEVWIYASGASKWWGGCHVWISLDGEAYQMIGAIKQPARQGVLTASLSASSSHIDNTNTLAVDMTPLLLRRTQSPAPA